MSFLNPITKSANLNTVSSFSDLKNFLARPKHEKTTDDVKKLSTTHSARSRRKIHSWLKVVNVLTKGGYSRPKMHKTKFLFEGRPTGHLTKAKTDQLRQTVRKLMTPGLGILAVDDSVAQLAQKLKAIHLDNTETNRRLYHEMLLSAETGDENWMESCFSSVLIREESLAQPGYSGKKLARLIQDRSVLLGIRFDKSVERLAGCDREYVSTGLDSVTNVIERTKCKGVKFGLFRCVFRISEFTPSRQAIVENSLILAKFAVMCQTSAIAPIVAVEVLKEGTYGSLEARDVLREILTTVVKIMTEHHVFLEGLLIRVSACQPGLCYKHPRDLVKIAGDTWKTLNECIPPAVGGVLLSRGEDLCTSLAILNHMQTCRIKKPFPVSFCYSRVIQAGVESLWGGQDKNLAKARAELIKRAEMCSLAALGQFQDNAWKTFFVHCEAYL